MKQELKDRIEALRFAMDYDKPRMVQIVVGGNPGGNGCGGFSEKDHLKKINKDGMALILDILEEQGKIIEELINK